MSDDRENKFPSTAHYENGKYVHDPLNQSLAEHEAQGRLGAHDNGQKVHPFPAFEMNG
jgi:hypothetical protein